jgi:hypothetical protein
MNRNRVALSIGFGWRIAPEYALNWEPEYNCRVSNDARWVANY